MTLTYVPEANDVKLEVIRSYLGTNSSVRMPASVPTPDYRDDLTILEVPHGVHGQSAPLECWFNCLKAQSDGMGQTVFGWAIWKDTSQGIGNEFYVAQHHAVLRTGKELRDITPLEVGAELNKSGRIIFIPDARVPFDCVEGKFPASLRYFPKKSEFSWAVRSPGTEWKNLDRFYVFASDDTSWKSKLPKGFLQSK